MQKLIFNFSKTSTVQDSLLARAEMRRRRRNSRDAPGTFCRRIQTQRDAIVLQTSHPAGTQFTLFGVWQKSPLIHGHSNEESGESCILAIKTRLESTIHLLREDRSIFRVNQT